MKFQWKVKLRSTFFFKLRRYWACSKQHIIDFYHKIILHKKLILKIIIVYISNIWKPLKRSLKVSPKLIFLHQFPLYSSPNFFPFFPFTTTEMYQAFIKFSSLLVLDNRAPNYLITHKRCTCRQIWRFPHFSLLTFSFLAIHFQFKTVAKRSVAFWKGLL